jgi:hypothetical protein
MYYMKLLVEAIVVGLVMVALDQGVSTLVRNRLLVVFLTGFMGHLLFELVGANKWYCTHGKACSNGP